MSAADLGIFDVAATAAEVAAFRRAAHIEGEGLPFTYPIRWLALPHVRTAVTTLLPEPGLVPFHEAQTFEYEEPLQVDVSYRLAVTVRREAAPDRLVIQGKILGSGGTAILAKLETVLRLLPIGQPK